MDADLAFSPGELEEMQTMQTFHMMDICLIAEPTVSTDTYNLRTESWDWTTALQSACGFNANPSQEVLNQVPESEVTLRLPATTVITNYARVRITYRMGQRQSSPLTYEVVGLPKLGPSGQQVWLKKITDGSDG